MGYKQNVYKRIFKKIKFGDGCWEWQNSIQSNGYGKVLYNNKMRWAHRVVYELLVGPIPGNRELDHLCRNPKCVRPEHLEVVTHKENMRRSPFSAPDFHRAKTHCPSGHPYSGSNLIVYHRMRYCRKCQQKHKRAYEEKNK